MSQKSSSYGTDESELDSDVDMVDDDCVKTTRRKTGKVKRWLKI